MKPRYEWVTGPYLTTKSERTEYHHGKGILENKGKLYRIFAGQIRDTELDIVLNYATEAPRNPLNARLALDELADRLPKAPDWTPHKLKPSSSGNPAGWTLPKPGAPFEQGIIV